MTSISQVCNEGLAILHFFPEGTDSRGSPAKILYEYMSGFLNHSSLIYEELKFDLSNNVSVAAHSSAVQNIAIRIQYAVYWKLEHWWQFFPDNLELLFLLQQTHMLEIVSQALKHLLHSRMWVTNFIYLLPFPIQNPQFLHMLLPPNLMFSLGKSDVTLWMMPFGMLLSHPDSYQSLIRAWRQWVLIELSGQILTDS